MGLCFRQGVARNRVSLCGRLLPNGVIVLFLFSSIFKEGLLLLQ